MFPSMVVQIINVGETDRRARRDAGEDGDFYEEEVDTAVAGMLTLLEPMMIAVPRRRRRRDRRSDVTADLQPNQQADLRETMVEVANCDWWSAAAS